VDTASRQRRRLFGISLLVLLVLAGCGSSTPTAPPPAAPAPQADTLASVHRAGALRVCSTGDYRPFTYLDPATGRWSGIDVDLARDMAQKLGVRLDLVHTTWATLLGDLTGGRCDAVMGGVSVTPDRAAMATFSAPYLVDGKAPITRCADAGRFRTLAEIDQPGVRVIVNPGGTNASYDHATLKRATIVEYPDNNTIFNQLLDNHADLMLTDASETRYQAAQHPGQLCAVNPDHPFTTSPKAYLLPHGDTAFQQWVDQWLKTAQSDGTYQRVSKPWTG
jgi:cyclohexadienyl dehydratase